MLMYVKVDMLVPQHMWGSTSGGLPVGLSWVIFLLLPRQGWLVCKLFVSSCLCLHSHCRNPGTTHTDAHAHVHAHTHTHAHAHASTLHLPPNSIPL